MRADGSAASASAGRIPLVGPSCGPVQWWRRGARLRSHAPGAPLLGTFPGGRRCAPGRGLRRMSVVTTDLAYQECINPACRATFAVAETHFACPTCGDLIDVAYAWGRLPVPHALTALEANSANRLDRANPSGAWRSR